ncbi:hypothetical protein NE236_41980 [Actinoallomurus purpureus]|uniref:hypothetical protein n=1 Tax=Actinoallomurus purpureus TaxID=478114 RepID=UPI0020935E12|nr:hypothetical protein [Actinoallomurus purpureus]MCO6011541.1 hypothetical protein [Actinoallomurus purpureus]
MEHATVDAASPAAFADRVVTHLAANFPADQLPHQQIFCLAEEAGEFVGAYRRWAGMARRRGPWDDVRMELADVVLTAHVAALVLDIAPDALANARDSLGNPATYDDGRQVRAVFRAAAQVVEAYDRPVPSTSLLVTRIAVVLNVAYATAKVLNIDLDEAIRHKAYVISTRGWRDPAPATA